MVRFERSIAFSFPLPFPGKKRTRATTERCRSLFFPTRFAAIVVRAQRGGRVVTAFLRSRIYPITRTKRTYGVKHTT